MVESAQAQNIYDDKEFFEGHIQLPRQVQGLDGAPEWPVFRSMIPYVKGAKVLDLGCGPVLAVDVSSNMLAMAQKFPEDPAITYVQADLESFEIPSATYDVVLSSLAVHYLKNLAPLVAQVFRRLKPGVTFVFCTDHPIYTAPRKPEFIKDVDGKVSWAVNQCLSEGQRITNWFADGVVKYHRTIATYITMLLDAGFILSAINEWGPSIQQLEGQPDWYRSRERPMFLIIKATKPAA